MREEVLAGPTLPDARLAAARSRAYRLFAEALGYPEGPLGQAIRSGELARALREAFGAVDQRLPEGADLTALADAGEADELAVEYTRLFDMGPSGPPCPLYGGLYAGGARMKTMEEAVRFYDHFGLRPSDKRRELPDHLSMQLEFLHYLAFREAEAFERAGDPAPYRRAQRDFVARHPARWVPRLRERLERQQPMRFFRELLRQLERFLEHERQHLIHRAAEPDRDAIAEQPVSPSRQDEASPGVLL